MKRKIFDEGWYSFTVTRSRNLYDDSEQRLPMFELALTCDTGKRKEQSLNLKIPTTHLSRLNRFCDAIGYEHYGEITDDTFHEQFIGFRLQCYVSIKNDGTILTNFIKSFKTIENEPDIDVLSEKSTDQFNNGSTKKRLPLNL